MKEEASYRQHGPISEEAPVPIMAGWDDHDYGYNDAGSDYACKEQSQVKMGGVIIIIIIITIITIIIIIIIIIIISPGGVGQLRGHSRQQPAAPRQP